MIIDDKYNQNNTLKTESSLEGFKSVIIETYSYEYEFFSDCNFTNNNGETILINQEWVWWIILLSYSVVLFKILKLNISYSKSKTLSIH